MLLHPIGIGVLMLLFGEMLAGLDILLKQLHALSVQLIGLAFDDDGDFFNLWIIEPASVSCII